MTAITLSTRQDTMDLAARVATRVRPGMVLALSGDLGAGKTTFSGDLLAALGWRDVVPSPTFTLVNVYDTLIPPVWHFDCYRLEHPEEILEAGWDEAASGLRVVEWPERIRPLLPVHTEWLHFAFDGRQRSVDIKGCGT